MVRVTPSTHAPGSSRSVRWPILIDAPFNRPQHGRIRGDLSLTPTDRDEQSQLIHLRYRTRT